MKKVILFASVVLMVLLILTESVYTQGIDPNVFEQKFLEARKMLEKDRVFFEIVGKGKSSRIVSREILLIAYSLKNGHLIPIKLEVVVPKSLSDGSFKFKVKDTGVSTVSNFDVKRIAGFGVTRLEFSIYDKQNHESLIVWDSRHLHLENKRTSPRDLFYAPYSDFFQDEYFTKKGLVIYRAIIEESRRGLCKKGAKSKAYPQKLLCEVFSDETIMALGTIEQMDDGEFFNNSRYAIKKFLAHIARNGEKAFYYSISSDGARGLMQFMNSKKIRTYDLVRGKYPEVGLIADFESGTANMKNSIKSAVCLADTNFAQMSKEKRNEEAAIVAHNGGLGRALNFLQGKRIPKETQNFIKKYRETRKILEEFEKSFVQERR